jgi:hypothetical protein
MYFEANSSAAKSNAQQVTLWWGEAETAIQAEQVPRARRFLRWILAVHPEDEEAWLRLARLAPTPGDQLACLQQAYAYHPDSYRTIAALREARIVQLESAVQELIPRPGVLHCLPDHRRTSSSDVRSQNGNGHLTSSVPETAGRSSFRLIPNLI